MDCMIAGDSIAVGVSMYRRECVSYAKGGWNSWQWNKQFLYTATARAYSTVIISLGANDHEGVRSFEELRKLRTEIKADRVFWISPGAKLKPRQQTAIEQIAAAYGDVVLPRPEAHMSPDGVHPTPQGYKLLAGQTK